MREFVAQLRQQLPVRAFDKVSSLYEHAAHLADELDAVAHERLDVLVQGRLGEDAQRLDDFVYRDAARHGAVERVDCDLPLVHVRGTRHGLGDGDHELVRSLVVRRERLEDDAPAHSLVAAPRIRRQDPQRPVRVTDLQRKILPRQLGDVPRALLEVLGLQVPWVHVVLRIVLSHANHVHGIVRENCTQRILIQRIGHKLFQRQVRKIFHDLALGVSIRHAPGALPHVHAVALV